MAMIGLVFAGLVLVVFVIPALVDGRSPTLVALVAGTTIAGRRSPLAYTASRRTPALP